MELTVSAGRPSVAGAASLSGTTSLAQAVNLLADSGRSVTAQKAVPEKLKYRKLVRFKDGGIIANG